MVRRVVLGHAVRLSSWSTARRIHDETERIVAHFTTVAPTSDWGARAAVGLLLGMSGCLRTGITARLSQRDQRNAPAF